MRGWPRLRAVTSKLLWSLLLPVLLLLCPPQSHALKYEVVPCCGPCPAANDRANYNTGFLSIFPILMQGEEDWLFRSDVELVTEFGPDALNLQQLKLFADMLKARGTELVVIYHPTRGLVHPSKVPSAARYDYKAASANYRDA